MSPQAQLEAFAQSIYLVIKNRYFDDIEGDDGVVYVSQVIDWTNMYLDELESETDNDGEPINWSFQRQNGATLGTAVEGEASITFPTEFQDLIADEQRYVQILQDTSVISNWAVVTPDQISSQADRITEDMVSNVNGVLVFSRAFRDTENNGTIIGDVTGPLPRMTKTNVKALNIVKPKTLLILGVAKNATLPDIVQGGLSPSYAQKYGDLLKGAIAKNSATSQGDMASRDVLSGIGGVGV